MLQLWLQVTRFSRWSVYRNYNNFNIKNINSKKLSGPELSFQNKSSDVRSYVGFLQSVGCSYVHYKA